MAYKAMVHRLELLSESGATADTAGGYVSVPEDVDDYYIKIDATEDSAGGVTVNVYSNEAESATNERVIHTSGALSATGVTRTDSANVSGTGYLSPQLQVDLASLTGEWTVVVELWYSKRGEN